MKWFELRKRSNNWNDIVSMIWGLIQQIEHIIQIDTDLRPVAVDDDMIWVIQKKQQIEMILLVWSEE